MSDATASPLGRLNGRVSLWLARCAAFILAMLALLTFIDVAGRYLVNKPFSFTVELTEMGMGLIVYFSVGLVTHERGHVAVDFVTSRMSPRRRAILDIVVQLLALAFLSFMVWRLFLRAGELFAKGDYTPILYLPIWSVAVAMAVGGLLFLTGTLLHLASALAKIVGGRGTS